MDDVAVKIFGALTSQCGLSTGILVALVGALVWWIKGQQDAYRDLEAARDADRRAWLEEAGSRTRAFESLAAALNEMKGTVGTLTTVLLSRKG